MVSDILLETAEFDAVHVNTEFSELLGRASDHDPLIARFTLANLITGIADRDVLIGTDEADLIKVVGERDRVTTGGGQDVIAFESIRNAGSLITDFEVGADLIDLSYQIRIMYP